MKKNIISAAVSAAIICGAVPMTVNAEETGASGGGVSVSLPRFSTNAFHVLLEEACVRHIRRLSIFAILTA